MTEKNTHAGKVVYVTLEQQRASGLLLFIMAEKYRSVALKGSEDFSDDNHAFEKLDEWIYFHDPICNLFGHATELYLKSFLVASGCQKNLAGKALGHKLDALLAEAEVFGLVLCGDAAQSILALNSHYGRAPYALRYPSLDGMKLSFPLDLSDACNDLRKNVYSTVCRKARSLGAVMPDNP